MRRLSLLALALAMLAFFQAPGANAQKRRMALKRPWNPQPTPTYNYHTNKEGFHDVVTYPAADQYKRKIEAVRELIKEKDWNRACEALQGILDSKKDLTVEISQINPRTKKETTRRVSIKFEANRLLGELPQGGLAKYRLLYEGEARQRLDEAKKASDPNILGDVELRYRHTEAGQEAADLLASNSLDKYEFYSAATYYRRLLLERKKVKLSKVKALTLYKAALSFRLAGPDFKDSYKKVWAALEKEVRQNGFKIGKKRYSFSKLEELIADVKAPTLLGKKDWPMWGGGQNRNGTADASAPLVEPTWIFSDIDQEVDEEKAKHTDTAAWVKIWTDQQERLSQPILSGFHPVAAKGMVIYRNYDGIYALWIKDGKDAAGNKHKAGELAWRSDCDGGITSLLDKDKGYQTQLNEWQTMYRTTLHALIGENSAVGTLTTDHQRVYLIDDLAIPPHPSWLARFMYGNQPSYPEGLQNLVKGNVLKAFDIDSGKLSWELPDRKNPGELGDTHFLGAPLPVGGKLYALNEKKSEFRLICIDPANGQVLHVQPLCTVKDPLERDIVRRMHSVDLAYGEGILVIPTNAGALIGVDLLTRSLIWSYPYRETIEKNTGPINPWGRWGQPQVALRDTNSYFKNSPPIIHNGKVVFAAPDGESIHCVDLREGTRDWHVKRADDLYLAGVYGKRVLLVGKNGARALNLDNGRQLWALDVGVPTGYGVASKGIYYLPLKNRDKRVEICAIDIANGRVKAHNPARKTNAQPLGNLLFHEGALLSQSASHVAAYPQLEVRMQELSGILKEKPEDLAALTERGELRLADGKLQPAVTDLRKVLKLLKDKPNKDVEAKARQKLYEAFTELFQKDFDTAVAKYQKEYEGLCTVKDNPAEQSRRKARYLYLMGRGREHQGRLVDAYQHYVDFAALPTNKDQVSDIDDNYHKARPDVWVRGRIAAMMREATPNQRRPLDAKITKEWNVAKTKDIDAIRRFVQTFDVPFQVGRKARLALADRLMEKNDKTLYLEAEQLLLQLKNSTLLQDDEETLARATEGLARLAIRRAAAEKGAADSLAMQEAVRFYQELGSKYPKVVVKGGKTGADIVNDLAADKRLLPYLNNLGEIRIAGKVKGSEPNPNTIGGNTNWWKYQNSYVLEPEGEVPLLFRKYRLVYSMNNRTLTVMGRADNSEKWSVSLNSLVNTQYVAYLNNFNQTGNVPAERLQRFQARGHLAVVQLGPMVYGLDVINQKILWERNMLDQAPNMWNFRVDADKDGSLKLTTYDRFTNQPFIRRVGMLGAVSSSYVCIQTQKGLVALDPLKGTELWSKSNVPARTQVFGDDQYVYLVEVRDGTVVGGARCLRASDGVRVDVPDFGTVYQNRLKVIGRNLLLSEATKESVTLRLYDVHTGKDLWKQTFEKNAIPIQSREDHLAGVVEPNGKVTVVDLRRQKIVLKTRVDEADLKDVKEAILLEDGQQFYLALNKPVEASVVNGGVLYTNFANGTHWALVNGLFYAFDHKGKLRWNAEVTRQLVILEEFKKMPVVVFSARWNLQGVWRWMAATKAIDKKTGKLVWDPDPKDYNGYQFYALNVNVKKRTIDLLGGAYAVRFAADDSVKPRGKVESGNKVKDPGTNPGKVEPKPIRKGRGRGIRPLPPVKQKGY
jgi:outer membrane protein assembly factor BamB